MRNPWLSVIMPSHNGERWLAAALQSVVDQGESGIEVIFVDSSASEASLQIAASFAGKLEIRTYRRLDLVPWPAKTNFGVAEARGEWICILHVDDLWLPGRSRALRAWLSGQCGGVLHLHPAYIVDGEGKKLGIWRCPLPQSKAAVSPQIMLERLLLQNFVPVPAATIRRETFLEVGGMDEALWHTADWDLYLKLAAAGTVYYHPQPLARYRIHGNSLGALGSRNLGDFRDQLETVLDRHIEKLSGASRKAVLRLASASIEMNTALAAANAGRPLALVKAFASILKLGPLGIYRYFYYSRIIDRALPRLRARLAGKI